MSCTGGYVDNAINTLTMDRCPSTKTTQLFGEMRCSKPQGHHGMHFDDRTGERWN